MDLHENGADDFTLKGIELALGDLRDGVSFQVVDEYGREAVSLRLILVAEAPRPRVAAEIIGDGTIGSEHRATAGSWSGHPEPALAFTWLRNGVEITGATQQGYVPDADDNSCAITCRVEARNAAGTAAALTAPRTMVHSRPSATIPLLEAVFDRGSGVQTIDLSGYFRGQGLSFAATGAGATIEPGTGTVSIAVDEAVAAREVVVTAKNSGGSASLTLRVTVEAEEADGASVGFAGPTMVQLLIGEGEIVDPEPVAVEGATSHWLDPNDRLGGLGVHEGVEGNFSGGRSTAVPRSFTAWSVYRDTEYSDPFSVVDPSRNGCAADDARKWRLEVNGRDRPVAAIYRKTVPTCTRLVDPSTWRSTRRHLVTLSLTTPLAPGDVVMAVPPGELEPLHQVYQPDVVSEAIHVCHIGYPTVGPKKGYVGLWLGHDGSGTGATTDQALSAQTRWRLVRVRDSVTTADGTLALAKARADDHMSGLNFNGCDIYVADFSDFDGEGTYRLEVDGFGASVPFPIAARPYAEALRLGARAYFFQRSGCEISVTHGEGIARPRNGHPADGLPVYQTNLLLGRHSEGFTAGAPVFPALQSWPLVRVSGESFGTEHVFADALGSPARWRTLPSLYTLAGGVLTISGFGYRMGDLNLERAATAGKEYRVTIVVDKLNAAGSGLVARFAGAGSLVLFSQLAQGTNTVRVQAAAGYPRLQIDAGGTTTATVSSISVREVTKAGVEERAATNPDAWGGWHDAGDWDRRIQHMDTVYMMAQMVESFPVTRSLHLNIPEGGRTFADAAVQARRNPADQGDGFTVLPDLVHEALWGISLWRRTQGATGGIIGGVEYSLDGIEGSLSWDPVQTTYAYAEEEWAAYLFAASAAKLGHVVKTVCGDAVLGNVLIAEAIAAWTWAEGEFATGLDVANGSGGDPATVSGDIMVARLRAAASLYRSAGTEEARAVWESYNAFLRSASTGLRAAGTGFGSRGDYAFQALDYAKAGDEGRSVNAAIAKEIRQWCGNRVTVDGALRLGADYGLHSTSLYGWGASWFRFGPASNWWASRTALSLIARGSPSEEDREAVLEGLWFALGCNPSNISLVQGLGRRTFADPLVNDFRFPGLMSVGPAAGPLQDYEVRSVGDSLYPKRDADWPHYARVFDSRRVVRSAEFGVKSNLMEWLFANAFANNGETPG